ncbi:Plasmid pRiA4b ORF-3-like protein [Pirellula sp. SH-Sr6A]|uniref:plasmid pRiA4b ORF-3 family protein n=1 Tax=Pirellula sp. SH-Sr6A TaxID=1632865 RepID=UPI00078EB98F|nr:plasmid pRiA4b ORF-3 family protein [Pirellula sp. SH-Sr6A]AMV32063.1 Plasmid pRiA4b ORF-3-like protein [Pirellula sp. SH-Sr6A]
MAKKKPTNTDLTDQSVALAEFAAEALIAAGQLQIKKKTIVDFPLDEAERTAAADFLGMTATLNRKLKSETGTFTVADIVSILKAVADALLEGEPLQRLRLLFMAKKLTDCLQSQGIPTAPTNSKAKKSKPTKCIYQFKITLLGTNPPIWRRIQVEECTLDKLHEHIQTAMGWTNSHLHRFDIEGKRYGDPELLDDGFEDFECVDSTKTNLSRVLPKTGKRFGFKYKYDFGDGWEHEILFEGTPAADPKLKYPLCLEGERACPPEDCGGVWGYDELLEAICSPKHDQHEDMLEWIGGKFDSEDFDPKKATKEMRKGLPDWRNMS